LVGRRARTLALDGSSESVASINARLAGRESFLGARQSGDKIPLDDQFADVVFLIEAVEHMDDSMLSAIFSEVRRILRPGGRLVVTTPNAERLDLSDVICPNCACVFNAYQHVRSFTPESLTAATRAAGFRTVVCRETWFSTLPSWIADLERAWRLIRRQRRNLLYVGQV
jgi:SAM-dependent methyltransferase